MTGPAEEPVKAEEQTVKAGDAVATENNDSTEAEPTTTEKEPTKTDEPSDEKEDSKSTDSTEAAEATKPAKSTEDSKPTNVLKTTASIDRRDHAKNSKYDASKLPPSEDADAMRRQVEFYFNDANLPMDEHMWKMTGGPENKPVPLKHIAAFSRMKRFPNYEKLVAALKESSALKVTGEPGEEVVSRKVPYVLSTDKSKHMKRSVYVKGFGDEEPTTQFDLEAFFSQFGHVNSVRLRRTEEKLFKGSVFVEFHDEEGAKKFLELDPKPKWKGHDLKIMSKEAYVREKKELIDRGELEPQSSYRRFWEGQGGKGGKHSRGRGGKGGRVDKDDWKKRREDDQKSGFRNGHGRGGRGRGGRGRGRGGHGRGGRDRDEGKKNGQPEAQDDRNGAQPVIQTTTSSGEPATANNKRPRSEDDSVAEPQAKKVDTKADAA